MVSVPRVLLFVCDASQKAILQQTLAHHAELVWADNLQEMTQQLERARYDALFCSSTLSTGSWGEALKQVRQFYPDVPVIILSKTSSQKEWMEVLDAGAFDLLGLPCSERTLLSVMEHAVDSCEARAWHPISGLQTA